MESFALVIANVVALSTSEVTQFTDQGRIRLPLQLINSISKCLQKLLKYFDDTAISALKIPALLVLSKNLHLNSNDSESLQNWYQLIDVSE